MLRFMLSAFLMLAFIVTPCLSGATLLDLTGDADQATAAANGEKTVLRFAADAATTKTLTHFDSGKPHWILAVDAEKRLLRVQPLADHGVQAMPHYTEQGNSAERSLDDWPSRYTVNLLPLAELAAADTAGVDLCRLALWFHARVDGGIACNRTLAALHAANTASRPAIEGWLREQQFDNTKGKFELVAVWDVEFKRTRNQLMPAPKAKEYRKRRETQADDARKKLFSDYADTGRTVTLEALHHSARVWLEEYPDTASFKGDAAKVRQLSDTIDADHRTAAAAHDKGRLSAASAKEEKANGQAAKAAKHWLGAAESHDSARELDPGNAAYLACAAEAWLAYGDPEFKGDQWICTREDGIKKALPLYEQLAKLNPDVKGYQQNADLCRRILGK